MSAHHVHEPGATPERDQMTRLVRGCVVLLLSAFIFFSRTIAVPRWQRC